VRFSKEALGGSKDFSFMFTDPGRYFSSPDLNKLLRYAFRHHPKIGSLGSRKEPTTQ